MSDSTQDVQSDADVKMKDIGENNRSVRGISKEQMLRDAARSGQQGWTVRDIKKGFNKVLFYAIGTVVYGLSIAGVITSYPGILTLVNVGLEYLYSYIAYILINIQTTVTGAITTGPTAASSYFLPIIDTQLTNIVNYFIGNTYLGTAFGYMNSVGAATGLFSASPTINAISLSFIIANLPQTGVIGSVFNRIYSNLICFILSFCNPFGWLNFIMKLGRNLLGVSLRLIFFLFKCISNVISRLTKILNGTNRFIYGLAHLDTGEDDENDGRKKDETRWGFVSRFYRELIKEIIDSKDQLAVDAKEYVDELLKMISLKKDESKEEVEDIFQLHIGARIKSHKVQLVPNDKDVVINQRGTIVRNPNKLKENEARSQAHFVYNDYSKEKIHDEFIIPTRVYELLSPGKNLYEYEEKKKKEREKAEDYSQKEPGFYKTGFGTIIIPKRYRKAFNAEEGDNSSNITKKSEEDLKKEKDKNEELNKKNTTKWQKFSGTGYSIKQPTNTFEILREIGFAMFEKIDENKADFDSGSQSSSSSTNKNGNIADIVKRDIDPLFEWLHMFRDEIKTDEELLNKKGEESQKKPQDNDVNVFMDIDEDDDEESKERKKLNEKMMKEISSSQNQPNNTTNVNKGNIDSTEFNKTPNPEPKKKMDISREENIIFNELYNALKERESLYTSLASYTKGDFSKARESASVFKKSDDSLYSKFESYSKKGSPANVHFLKKFIPTRKPIGNNLVNNNSNNKEDEAIQKKLGEAIRSEMEMYCNYYFNFMTPVFKKKDYVAWLTDSPNTFIPIKETDKYYESNYGTTKYWKNFVGWHIFARMYLLNLFGLSSSVKDTTEDDFRAHYDVSSLSNNNNNKIDALSRPQLFLHSKNDYQTINSNDKSNPCVVIRTSFIYKTGPKANTLDERLAFLYNNLNQVARTNTTSENKDSFLSNYLTLDRRISKESTEHISIYDLYNPTIDITNTQKYTNVILKASFVKEEYQKLAKECIKPDIFQYYSLLLYKNMVSTLPDTLEKKLENLEKEYTECVAVIQKSTEKEKEIRRLKFLKEKGIKEDKEAQDRDQRRYTTKMNNDIEDDYVISYNDFIKKLKKVNEHINTPKYIKQSLFKTENPFMYFQGEYRLCINDIATDATNINRFDSFTEKEYNEYLFSTLNGFLSEHEEQKLYLDYLNRKIVSLETRLRYFTTTLGIINTNDKNKKLPTDMKIIKNKLDGFNAIKIKNLKNLTKVELEMNEKFDLSRLKSTFYYTISVALPFLGIEGPCTLCVIPGVVNNKEGTGQDKKGKPQSVGIDIDWLNDTTVIYNKIQTYRLGMVLRNRRPDQKYTIKCVPECYVTMVFEKSTMKITTHNQIDPYALYHFLISNHLVNRSESYSLLRLKDVKPQTNSYVPTAVVPTRPPAQSIFTSVKTFLSPSSSSSSSSSSIQPPIPTNTQVQHIRTLSVKNPMIHYVVCNTLKCLSIMGLKQYKLLKESHAFNNIASISNRNKSKKNEFITYYKNLLLIHYELVNGILELIPDPFVFIKNMRTFTTEEVKDYLDMGTKLHELYENYDKTVIQ